jgi:hypothetical protein
MAWIENLPWEMEQGRDAELILQLLCGDEEGSESWPFVGWDVNSTIRDSTGDTVLNVTVATNPEEGEIKLILPEVLVNTLRPSKPYVYECLLVAPGEMAADDYFVAAAPVTVALRSTRRDPE